MPGRWPIAGMPDWWARPTRSRVGLVPFRQEIGPRGWTIAPAVYIGFGPHDADALAAVSGAAAIALVSNVGHSGLVGSIPVDLVIDDDPIAVIRSLLDEPRG